LTVPSRKRVTGRAVGRPALIALLAGLLAGLLAASGCVWTVVEPPRVLPPGGFAVSGLSGFAYAGALVPSDFGVQLNAGVAPRVDAGLRASLGSGLYGQFRYQALTEPLLANAGIGLSYLPPTNLNPFSHVDNGRTRLLGLHPTITLGDDRRYCGLRVGALWLAREGERHNQHYREESFGLSPELVGGFVLGDRVQFIPEVFLIAMIAEGKVEPGAGANVAIRIPFGNRDEQPGPGW
jgi:hypothetical protein